MREGHALPYPGTPALTHPFDPCGSHGGFYLGSIGGPAARLAQDCIRGQEVLEYPELGMEAVWKIAVEDFPPSSSSTTRATTSSPTSQVP
jgi:hypothetical protein